MSKAQKMRLQELVMKASRTEEENKELVALKDVAAKASYKFDEKTGAEIEEGLSADDVKKLVSDSVGAALKIAGLDEESVKSLKTALEGAGKIDVEAIKSAIASAKGAGKLDVEAMTKAIKENMPAGMATTDGVKALLEEFKKDMIEATRAKSKMVFDDSNAPLEHRSGNLTVGQKQLLNICLMNAPDKALEDSNGGHGIKRPSSMNEGISADQVKTAERNGNMYTKSIRDSAVYGGKTLTTGGSGTGAEFMNVVLSSDLLARMYLASELAARMVASEIQMPSDPFKFPLSTTRTKFYKGTEASAPSASDPGTAGLTLDAEKLIGIAQYSYEADEDSIVAMLPFLMDAMSTGAAESLEDAFINGDTTGTHMDSDTHALGATDHRKLFKGFRKYAIAGSILSSFATGGISAANIAALRKMMKKYGIKPSDLLIVAGVNGYNDIVSLDETLTAEKAGANAARILTGVAPTIYGIPIITSEKVREDLNASGVYDGATTTKGSLLMVHRPSFVVGVRRGFTVETDVDKSAQINKVIASFRRAFMPMETPSTTLAMVGMGYNYDS